MIASTSSRRMGIVLVAELVLALSIQSAHAVSTLTWGGAPGAAWSTSSTNWSAGTATPWDTTNGPTDLAYFTSGSSASISGTVNANGLIFAGSSTITGGALNLVGTTPTITTSAASTIAASITGSAGMILAGTGTITLSGTNSYSGITSVSGSGNVSVVGNNSAATGGWAIDTASSGATTVTFQAGSVVSVASSNSFQVGASGAINSVSLHTLTVDGTISDSGSFYVGREANVTIASGAVVNVGRSLTVAGQGGASAIVNVNAGASLTYSGTSAITINPGTSPASFVALNVNGGTMTTSAGFQTTVSGGTNGNYVNLENNGVLQLSASTADLTPGTSPLKTQFLLSAGTSIINTGGFNASISSSITGTGGLSVLGGGILTLSGSNNTYSGGTAVAQGTVDFSNANSMPAIGAVNVASGATLAVGVGGSGQFTSATSGIGSLGGLIGGPSVAGSGSQGQPINWSAGSSVGIDTSSASATYAGVITDTTAGSLGLTKIGSNALTLSNVNTYSGPTAVVGGSLRTSIDGAFSTNKISVNKGGSLWFNTTESSSSQLAYTNQINLNGGTLDAGPASYAVQGESGYVAQGAVNLGGPISIAGTAAVASSARTPFNLSGQISGSGTLFVTYAAGAMPSGSGGVNPGYSNITLSNTANNWTGGTIIGNGGGGWYANGSDANRVFAASLGSGPIQLGSPNAGYLGQGFLYLTAPGAINPSSIVTMYDTVSADPNEFYSEMDLQGNSQTFAGLNSAGGDGSVGQYCRVLSANGSPTLTINNIATSTFNGVISSALSLNLGGPGTQVLTGSDTYIGGTTVSGGTLQLGSNIALGSTSGTLNVAGGTLDIHSFSPNVGAVTLTSGSIVDNLGGGTLNAASYTVLSGLASANLGGLGALTETSTGTVILSGSNSYEAGTFVNSGNLVLDGAASLLAGSSLTIGSGAGPGAVFAPPASSSSRAMPASLAPVPEPGTVVLLAVSAIAGLGIWRRRN